MKTPDNKDYEDLYKLYTESSCAYNKKSEDDEKEKDEDKKVVEEESEEDDDVVEESSDIDCEKTKDGYYLVSKRLDNGNLFKRKYQGYSKKDCLSKFKKELKDEKVVEEGVFDRMKARASGVKDAMSASATHMKKAFGGAKGERSEVVGSKFNKSKSYSIMNSHAVKLDKQLSSLVTDATKLGIMDADQAEEWATGISDQIHSVLKKLAGNKSFSNKGKKNF